MYDAPEPPAALPPPPPCAICAGPGHNAFWGVHLCDSHADQWDAEAPTLSSLDLAHATAHPEDIEAQGEYTIPVVGRTDQRWVFMKPGVSTRLARDAALAWVQQVRRGHLRSA